MTDHTMSGIPAFIYPNGEPADLTPAQWQALVELEERRPRPVGYAGHNETPAPVTVSPMLACGGAVSVGYAGMFLAIEADGYTHS